MHDTILYIGLTQSVFAAIIIYLKTPLSISDKILGGWLIHIAYLLGFALFRRSFPDIPESSWVGDLNSLISFPPFIYLYTKYSVQEQKKFNINDLLHFLPVMLSIIILLIVADWPSQGFAFGYNLLNAKIWLRNILGAYLLLSLWVYLYRSYVLIADYRSRIVDLFSYESEKNNYFWLQVVIILFALNLNLTLVLGALNEYDMIHLKVGIINRLGLVLFVYAVSFWGFRQNQLLVTQKIESIEKGGLDEKVNKKDSYRKTGLKDENVDAYLDNLIATMSKTEIWKNPEISVGDLSNETKIPKHYITQLLNEKLEKNFYTFVNEYRTEGAMTMLRSADFDHWSIIAIAFECGFNSKSAFNNFFKKHTGMTPSAYKKQTNL
ncbi:AraC family transcriptional regulator [Labilibacter sediminis]|nr:AraC family transcriptional regulator [Labilibacter sediminis]